MYKVVLNGCETLRCQGFHIYVLMVLLWGRGGGKVCYGCMCVYVCMYVRMYVCKIRSIGPWLDGGKSWIFAFLWV